MKKRKSLINLRLYHNKLLRIRRKRNNSRHKIKEISINNTLLRYMLHTNNFIDYFTRLGFISEIYVEKEILVPKVFSLKKNFNETILFFKSFFSSYMIGYKSITINFSKCEEACISCFTLLDTFFSESGQVFANYNQRVKYPFLPNIRIIKSFDDKVSKFLHVFGYESVDPSKINADDAYLSLGLEKGKQRTYKENKKSVISGKIVKFINNSIKEKLNYELNAKGINAIDGFITEILGNAEDHSLKGSEWYVNGVSFYEQQHETDVVELNLSIINIGKSMYEGFEETKIENEVNYIKLESLYNQHSLLFTSKVKLEKESLFTFYLLKEGFSRLKYEKISRGNGTMNFINAFMTLGSFGENNDNFLSDLNIISGHTVLSINNNYKPHDENGVQEMSLNKAKDVNLLPDKECLSHNNQYFPGTILECKIFLNNDFFKKKLDNGK